MRWNGIAAGLLGALLLLPGCERALEREKKTLETPSPADAAVKLDLWEQKEVAQEAYVYAFPMLANYKAMYEISIDRSSSQFKAPFNRIWSDSKTLTPRDTAVVTPNADTPYSLLYMDLRAEPLVLCVPDVEAGRYYSVQLIDMYTFNYGYIGSRTTGNGAGCYLISGPGWNGDEPPGIGQSFASETEFSLAIFRTQLFGPGDMENVKKIQDGYRILPLSSFLATAPPPEPPQPAFPKFEAADFKTGFASLLNFLLQFAPAVPEETALRARFAGIGIGAGRPYDYAKLPLEDRLALGLGIKDGYEAIQKQRLGLGRDVNGWRVGSSFGDRAFYDGNWLLRAAAAMGGLYGNDAAEALYPAAFDDSTGAKLDASRHRYTLTFPAGQLPPVNAFWSVTLYDAKTQLLVENPIDRYLINSPMLPGLEKGSDGSLTLYIQKDSPGAGHEANWLPAPDGGFYLVMRLYWPKPAAFDGSWKPAPVVRAAP